MENAYLVVEHLTKCFRDETAIEDISFHGQKGEIIGFSGHNGCGKTVLFKCICGLLRANRGEIRIANKPVGIGEYMPREISYTIEEPAFLGRYSGAQNLSMLYQLNHQRNDEVIQMNMERVKLDYTSRKPVKGYSLGMKQRLAIAQTLMDDKEFLIFDEPMNGLDREGVEHIRKLILEEKNKGKLILLASHNPGDLEQLANRVYYLENGKIVNCS